MMTADSPLQRAMAENGTEAGADPVGLGADEWLARLSELPLAFQPGEGWRYHHSFGILGILISRITGRPAGDHLRDDLTGPLGMTDTAFWAPADTAHRLPAAYRHTDAGLTETEPAGGGFYAGDPPFDVSHAELVSTAGDYLAFLRMLVNGGVAQTGAARGERMLPADLSAAMIHDQTPAVAKTPESFFPGFWDQMGWGFGVGIEVAGAHVGRYTWSGGQGTNFYVDPGRHGRHPAHSGRVGRSGEQSDLRVPGCLGAALGRPDTLRAWSCPVSASPAVPDVRRQR